MLGNLTRVLVIGQARNEKGELVTTNDFSENFAVWYEQHPAHVALQVVELEDFIFQKVKHIKDDRKKQVATLAKKTSVPVKK